MAEFEGLALNDEWDVQLQKLFIEHAPFELAMFDQDMCCLAASRRWIDTYGLEDRTFIGRNHYELFPEIGDDWREFHRRAIAGEHLKRNEDRFERADGQVMWVRWELVPWRSDDGQRSGFLAFTEDISEQVLARQTLESAHDTQRRMFGLIAHELRTPTAALSMLAASDVDNTELRERVGELSEHLLRVIDDLRTSVDPDRAVEVRVAPVAMAALVAGVEAQIRPLFSGGQMRYEVLDQTPADLSLEVDSYRLQSIITNLVRNSVYHSGGSKAQVSFVTRQVVDRAILKICVEDDGRGIPKDRVGAIFQPFQRGDTEASGLGVGLHIVRSWLESLGGDVSYRPSVLGGAAFEITLTCRITGSSGREQAPVSPVKTGLRVLLVEDDVLLQKLSRRMLEKHFDAQVQTANNGVEALALFAPGAFDLIITDYFMPEMDGLEMTRQIRARDIEVPIVGCSAATLGDEMARLKAAGVNQVLAKPLTVDHLGTVLRELL